MYNFWKSLYALNLSNNKDKDFKIAQILECNENALIFDLRQTFKGRRTKAGISLQVSEFEWFKNAIISGNKKVYTLEHGNKVIKVDNTLDEVLITVIKSDNTERKILIEIDELNKLIANINEIENKLISRALEMEIPTKFSDFNYVQQFVQ